MPVYSKVRRDKQLDSHYTAIGIQGRNDFNMNGTSS